MSVQRSMKEAVVQEIKEKMLGSRSIIFVDYKGLNVQRVTELRSKCRAAGVEMKVSKNTLARIAAREAGMEDIVPMLVESTAAFYGLTDPVAPAKVLDQFMRDNRLQLPIRGGIVEGKVIDEKTVQYLVDLPPREVLLGQVLGTMVAPITGFLSVLQGNSRSLLYALEARRKQLAGESA